MSDERRRRTTRQGQPTLAYGTFTATGKIGDQPAATFTRATLFQTEGRETPLALRFSTVIGGREASEAARGPRGFAVTFATEDGPWDVVGSNLPVSFTRDATRFADVVHALGPDPVTFRHEPRRILDVMADTPESMHMLTFLFSPRGIPADHRHQQGFGVTTSRMVNAAGRSVLVKYHFHPRQGVACLTAAEAAGVEGRELGHASRDLYEAIEAGDYPEWDLFVQLMSDTEHPGLDFHPLDETKVWPEDRFPLRHVGTLQLDRNASDVDAENEQVALGAGALVDGLDGLDVADDLGDAGPGQPPTSDYAQAADRWRTMTAFERDDLVANLVALLAECEPVTRPRMVWHLLLVDDDLGQRVGGGLGTSADDVAGLEPLPGQSLTEEDHKRLANLGHAGPRSPGAGRVTGSVPVRRLAETPQSLAHRLSTA